MPQAERVPRDGEIAPKTRNFFMDLDDETDIAFTVRSGGTVPVMLKVLPQIDTQCTALRRVLLN